MIYLDNLNHNIYNYLSTFISSKDKHSLRQTCKKLNSIMRDFIYNIKCRSNKYIEKYKNLSVLIINNLESIESVSFLENLIILHAEKIHIKDFKNIRNIKKLKYIYAGPNIIEYRYIKYSKNIEYISCWMTNVPLLAFKNLKYLDCNEYSRTNISIEILKNIKIIFIDNDLRFNYSNIYSLPSKFPGQKSKKIFKLVVLSSALNLRPIDASFLNTLSNKSIFLHEYLNYDLYFKHIIYDIIENYNLN